MSNAKVEGSQEYDLLAREVGEDMKRNDQRAPDELFSDRPQCPLEHVLRNKSGVAYHDIVPVPDPATEDLVHILASHPVFQISIDNAIFEQWPSEEDDDKEHGSSGVQ